MMNRRRLVIAIDCDDVLVPTAQLHIDSYNQAYNTTITLDSFYAKGDIWQAASEEEAIARVDKLLRGGMLDRITPSLGAVEAVKALASHHELHLVTGRPSYMEPVTQRLIDTYFPKYFESIEHTNYFAGVNNTARKRTKGEVCQAIGADILIDDHIEHGEVVIASGVQEVIVWGDYPWNKTELLADGMTRCATWDEVMNEVARVSHGA